MNNEPLQFNGRDIPAAVERDLKSYRLRLLRLRIHKGIYTTIDGDCFVIQVDKLGFTLLTVNGERNKHLESEVA